jgi:hypothetical protein
MLCHVVSQLQLSSNAYFMLFDELVKVGTTPRPPAVPGQRALAGKQVPHATRLPSRSTSANTLQLRNTIGCAPTRPR